MSGDSCKFALYVMKFFKEHIQDRRGFSHATLSSYAMTFSLFIRFIGIDKAERMEITEFTKDDVISFLKDLKETRGCLDSSCNTRLAHFKSFARFLAVEKPEMIHTCAQIAAIPFKKLEKKPPESLEKAAVEAILSAPDQRTEKGLRDAALLSLLYDSACRVEELIGLNAGDVTISGYPRIHVIGKGGKHRSIPLLKRTAALLKLYMDRYRLTEDNMILFRSRTGGRMTRQGVRYIMRKYAKHVSDEKQDLVSPERVHPHIFRHSKATHMIDSGKINIYQIKEFLGHESIQTTEIYLTPNAKRTSEAVKKASESFNIPTSSSYSMHQKLELDSFLSALK